MIGGVTSTGVKLCRVNVSRWGNPPSRGRIRVRSNSLTAQLTAFSGTFASLKVTIASQSTERLQQEQQVRVGKNNRQNTSFTRHVFVYVLSEHSIILRRCTPRCGGAGRGCMIAYKYGLLFPHLSGLPYLPGIRHLHVNGS